MSRALEFEVVLPSADPVAALELARRADAVGYDAVSLPDHLFQPKRFGDGFDGRVDPFTTLGAVAAVTGHVRLGQAVVCALFRHPVFVAKAIATLDRLSGGRAELGLGAGWYRAEFEAYGLEFPPLRERASRLEETVEVVDALLRGEPVSYSGRYYTLRDARFAPPPLQTPRPPIFLGGGAPRILALAGRLADGLNLIPPWLASGEADTVRALATPATELARKANRAREAAVQAGRDAEALHIVANLQVVVDPDAATVAATLAAGAAALGVTPQQARASVMTLIGTPAECVEKLGALREALGLARVSLGFLVPDQLEVFAKEVMPAFA